MNNLSPINYIQRYALIIAVCFAIMLCSCKTPQMVTHKDNTGDMYCLYKINDVKKKAGTQSLKKGDIVCLYCPGEFHCVLLDNRWIKLYTGTITTGQLSTIKDAGISYLLEPVNGNSSCTNCPGDNTFQLF